MKEIYKTVLNNIPDYDSFLSVNELDESSKALAKKYPDIVSIFEMGKTRDNHPLLCLKIGEGSKTGLMFGFPHPNEPIGTMMLEYFTKELAENKAFREELDYTWYIVKAWDADGARLNEEWFKGPFTATNYTRHFFRPAGHQQVDWTFPVKYKDLDFDRSIPETKAMMELIDKIKPDFIYSLHNGAFGGVYWYLTEDIKEVYDGLYESANKQEIPRDLGEPEAPYIKAFAPAIYKQLSIKDNYDYLDKYGVKNISEILNVGDCSGAYANERYNTFTLLTELPYFYNEKINDLSSTDKIRKDLVLDSLEHREESYKLIRETMEISRDYVDKNNPYFVALETFTKDTGKEADMKMIEENPEYSKNATVAEEFNNTLSHGFYKGLSYGLLISMNELEIKKMEENNEINNEKKEILTKAYNIALEIFEENAIKMEKELEYDVIPIKKLISIQLESGLIVADYLNR